VKRDFVILLIMQSNGFGKLIPAENIPIQVHLLRNSSVILQRRSYSIIFSIYFSQQKKNNSRRQLLMFSPKKRLSEILSIGIFIRRDILSGFQQVVYQYWMTKEISLATGGLIQILPSKNWLRKLSGKVRKEIGIY